MSLQDGARAPRSEGPGQPPTYREEWPAPSGYAGNPWRFVAVSTSVGGGAGTPKPRFNHYAIQLPDWAPSPWLDERQQTALHIGRKLLMRGEAPPPPRYLAVPEDTSAESGFAWTPPDWSSPDRSKAEEAFLQALAPFLLTPQSLRALHTQVPLSAFVRSPTETAGRIDFALLHPSLEGQILIEIDGEQHKTPEGNAADAQRDEAVRNAGHQVIRIAAREVEQRSGPGLLQLQAAQSKISEDGPESMGVLAAVQCMSVLVDLIEYGLLDPREAEWCIEVVGPHARAVAAGLQAARQLLLACADVYGCTLMPPVMDIVVDSSASQPDVRLEWRGDAPWFQSGPTGRPDRPMVRVRPTWLPARPALPVPPVDWVTPRADAHPAHFRTLLQTLYPEMEDFRDGQLFGIQRCLEGRDTIVLLPTGAGKSLIYQLAAFLMPGLAVVVAPLVALMKDQVHNMRLAGIDRVEALSGDMHREEKAALQERLKSRAHALAYVSPERFHIQDFRDVLVALHTQMPVPLFVIDEAHCLSEWGHDFRPAYLNIARTARKYGRRGPGQPPAVVGLTGTASRAVLRDLMAELAIHELEAVIMPKSFDRPELQFAVVACDSEEKEAALEGVLRRLPAQLRVPAGQLYLPSGPQTTCGIVFCPHVKGPFGVMHVAERLRTVVGHDVPYFAGGDRAARSERYASAFKENSQPLLVATKAFGMGIDKPNVRYTIHYGMTMSLEAFYQEAGRAGRDRRRAISTILVSVESDNRTEELLSPQRKVETLRPAAELKPADDITRALYFHASNFRGVATDVADVDNLMKELRRNVGQPVHALRYSDEDGEDRVLERALHRLIVLGIVEDYTKDYSARVIRARVHWPRRGEVWAKAYDHVANYSQARAQGLFESRTLEPGVSQAEEVHQAVRRLLEFTYDTIELGRRAAILSMWRWAKPGRTDKELRELLLLYLQETEFSREVDRILREAEFDLEQWSQLVNTVRSLRDLAELDAGLERALADFPDHPAVTAMKAIAGAKRRDAGSAALYSVVCFDALGGRFAAKPDLRWEFVRFVITEFIKQGMTETPGLVHYVSREATLDDCKRMEGWGLPQSAREGLIPRLAELAIMRSKSVVLA